MFNSVVIFLWYLLSKYVSSFVTKDHGLINRENDRNGHTICSIDVNVLSNYAKLFFSTEQLIDYFIEKISYLKD